MIAFIFMCFWAPGAVKSAFWFIIVWGIVTLPFRSKRDRNGKRVHDNPFDV